MIDFSFLCFIKSILLVIYAIVYRKVLVFDLRDFMITNI